MKLLSVDELPPELAAGWGTLVWSDHDPPQDGALFRKARARGVPVTDYAGLLAVEDREVLAQVMGLPPHAEGEVTLTALQSFLAKGVEFDRALQRSIGNAVSNESVGRPALRHVPRRARSEVVLSPHASSTGAVALSSAPDPPDSSLPNGLHAPMGSRETDRDLPLLSLPSDSPGVAARASTDPSRALRRAHSL